MTKTTLIFPAFSFRFVAVAVQFCFRCKFSFLGKTFKSCFTVIFLDQSQLFATHNNQWDCFILYRKQITTNGFLRVRQIGQRQLLNKDERFWNKKCCSSLLLYYIKQIDSMLPCVCSEGNLSTRRFWSDGDVYKRAWVRGRRRSRQIPNLSKEEFLRRQPFRNLLRKLRKPAVRKMSSWNKKDAVTSVWW